MNILILSWRGPKHPNAGGAELVTQEHAKAWVKAGHEVTLFTSSFQGAKSFEELDGVKIYRQGDQYISVKIWALFWYLSGKHKKFDLVIDHFHGIPFFTPVYVKVKKLAFIHEVAKEVWKLNPWPKPFDMIPSYFGRMFEPFIFKLLYKNIQFLTVSESTRDDLFNWGIPRKNVHIIYNGITVPKLLKPQVKDSKKTAVFLGAISEDKGIFDAIKIFSEINRKDDNWQFWIVGKGSNDYIKKMNNLAKSLNIWEKTKYWGFVGDRKKFELLARSHILVNPSIREGWGLVNIEANFVGTPVVGYSVLGIRDSVIHSKTGLLSNFGDYRSVARDALDLTANPKRYEEFRKHCVSWSKRFSWIKAGQQSLEFIESL